jgi:hypothetical protein
MRQSWWLDGRAHRVDGPASLEWRRGRLIYEAWIQNGRCHREDGPAHRGWDAETGELTLNEWWIDNRRLDAAEVAEIEAAD